MPIENPLLTELPEVVKELEAVDHVSVDAKDGGDLKQDNLDFACDEQLIKVTASVMVSACMQFQAFILSLYRDRISKNLL